MHLWQKAMIFLATHPGIKNIIQNRSFTQGLARRFVGGRNEKDAVSTAQLLRDRGLTSSFFFLGEYVRDPTIISATLTSLTQTLTLAREQDMDLHTSIDPTQAGLMQSPDLCIQNLASLAGQIHTLARPKFKDLLMIDMEDSSVTHETLAIFHDLAEQNLPVAITLQACLYRTPKDLSQVMERNTAIRLVKGAFAEKQDIAHQPGKSVDRAFLSLADTMLNPAALARGIYPVFATHDHRMIHKIIKLARSRQIPDNSYEFEMLLGVRPKLQKDLIERGVQVRLYLPYGRDFWPYAIRRVGENPKNIRFLLRSLSPI